MIARAAIVTGLQSLNGSNGRVVVMAVMVAIVSMVVIEEGLGSYLLCQKADLADKKAEEKIING